MNVLAKSTQRNYGVDLLRIVASFYVIILHTLNQGGLCDATLPDSRQYYSCRLLMTFTFCIINIFGLISGYVGYRESSKKISYSGYFPLWLSVVFYSVIITAYYMYCNPETITVHYLIDSFFPLTRRTYWFFSDYTLVFFLAPFLNRALQHSSDKECKLLFFIIILVIAMPEYTAASYSMKNGYSAIWLMFLYILGGILKKTGMGSKISPLIALSLIVAIDLCLFFLRIYVPDIQVLHFNIGFGIQSTFLSPFYISTAILHLLLFAKLKIPTFGKKIIAFAAPAVFSVYIVNTQPIFWETFMRQRFVNWAAYSPIGIIVRTVGFAFAFVAAVSAIDFFRRTLFDLIGVNTWSRKICGLFQKETNS